MDEKSTRTEHMATLGEGLRPMKEKGTMIQPWAKEKNKENSEIQPKAEEKEENNIG